MEEVGYVMPTEVQRQALPRLFTGRDCILHAQVHLTFSFLFVDSYVLIAAVVVLMMKTIIYIQFLL